MAIEVGVHPEAAGAVIIHSSDSGRFLPAGREEFIDFIGSVKRGELDPFLTGEVPSVHVWWPDPEHIATTIVALEVYLGRQRGDARARVEAAIDYWRKVREDIRA